MTGDHANARFLFETQIFFSDFFLNIYIFKNPVEKEGLAAHLHYRSGLLEKIKHP